MKKPITRMGSAMVGNLCSTIIEQSHLADRQRNRISSALSEHTREDCGNKIRTLPLTSITHGLHEKQGGQCSPNHSEVPVKKDDT